MWISEYSFNQTSTHINTLTMYSEMYKYMEWYYIRVYPLSNLDIWYFMKLLHSTVISSEWLDTCSILKDFFIE